MNILQKLWRADYTRKTRFHTSNGKLIISRDIANSLWSTIKRVSASTYPELPWITYPAIRFLQDRLTGCKVFEYGGGSSTAWYANYAESVTTVENNPEWFEFMKERSGQLSNVELILETDNGSFPDTINQCEGLFDVIVVDSQPRTGSHPEISTDTFRIHCLHASLDKATQDCLYVIDNTDILPNLSKEVDILFPTRQILRYAGWVPGNLHPNETTIVI